MDDPPDEVLTYGVDLIEENSGFLIVHLTSVTATFIALSILATLGRSDVPQDSTLVATISVYFLALLGMSSVFTIFALYWACWKVMQEWGNGKARFGYCILVLFSILILAIAHTWATLYFTGILDNYILLD